MKGSILSRLFPNALKHRIYRNPEVADRGQAGVVWSRLPKKIWVMWTSGLDSAPFSNRIAYEVMKNKLVSQGY